MTASQVGQARDTLAGSLFEQLPAKPWPDELFETLWANPMLRIERIVSTGQRSAPGFWYDQPQAEWVLLVQGMAILQFQDETQPRTLKAGDYVYIAPHRRHRIEMTQVTPATVWLAIHIEPER